VEEATTQLNRSILSRYHEEQIWSDKIRRMSTWGTWGLMGVNVLLFLIFQILIEPWRRRRLVQGFEEKVKEAIENEAATTRAITAAAKMPLSGNSSVIESPTASAHIATQAAPSDGGLVSEEVASNVGLISDPATAAPITTVPEGVSAETLLPDRPLAENVLSIEYWRQTVQSFLSDRSIILTQRELTTVAIQSAAAGAAVVGLVIALLRPR
jgi:sensitive to high expression protein 9